MANTQILAFPSQGRSYGLVNGDRPTTPTILQQLPQFEKIIQLRGNIVSGNHPTLKIKSQAVSRIVSTNDAAIEANSVYATRNLSSQIAATAVAGTNGTEKSSSKLKTTEDGKLAQLPVPSAPPVQSSSVAELDPIFLTKSEPLKRAELRIERQRVEKKLEEQIHHKRHAQKRESEQDSLPNFDVSDILIQAQELVKPLSASEVTAAANEAKSISNSVDENTFYSSQHNESDTEERADVRATKPCRFFFEGKCLKGDRCDWSHDPAFRSKLQATPKDAESDDAERGGRRPLRRSPSYGPRDRTSAEQAMEDGEINEDSYSPPRNLPPLAPDRPPEQTVLPRTETDDVRHLVDVERQGYASDRRRSGRHSPTIGNGRVIRNHITSPAAPQPARVSPLAVAKVPRIERFRHGVEDHSPRSGRQVPSTDNSPSSAQQLGSRKRPRRLSPSENVRNVASRYHADAPEPYIKPEPTSPIPLSQIQDVQGLRRAEPRSPLYYREVATADNRIVYEEVRPDQAPADQPMPRDYGFYPPGQRVVSGPEYEIRAEPNVRRIVSARQPLRPISPQPEYYRAPPSSHGALERPRVATPHRDAYSHVLGADVDRRPVSRAYVPLPEQERPALYRASLQPQPAPAYSRLAREGSPPSPTDAYAPPYRGPPTNGPARRIMVDKYGNEFYEASQYQPPPRIVAASDDRWPREMPPPAQPRASVHPEPTRAYDERYERRGSPAPQHTTYVDYRERHPPLRAPSRAPSRAAVIYERTQTGEYGPAGEYTREYPPRYDDPPPRIAAAQRASVAPQSQRPIYIDERPEPMYERSYRATTVQPGPMRYVDGPRPDTAVRQIFPEGERRIEYREPPRQAYQYLDRPPSDAYVSEYGERVIVDEHGRRLQRM